MEEEKLRVLLDEDIEIVLGKFGQLEAINNGDIFCQQCGTPISLKNIQIIIPLSEGIFYYICDRAECIDAHTKRKEGA